MKEIAMNRRDFMLSSMTLIGLSNLSNAKVGNSIEQAQGKPNILWITIEDWGPDLSCYGTKAVYTPHLDQLASEGIRYQRAFTTAPVCSASRSAMMTGFHQNYIRAHQHRTYDRQPLPHGIKPIPNLFAEAGYFTCLMSNKIDCNFTPNSKKDLFMGSDWTSARRGSHSLRESPSAEPTAHGSAMQSAPSTSLMSSCRHIIPIHPLSVATGRTDWSRYSWWTGRSERSCNA